MKTLIAIIKNIPDEINTEHLDVYVASRLYRDDFISDIKVVVKPMPRKLDANDWHRMFSGEYKIREAKGYGWNAYINELLGEEE